MAIKAKNQVTMLDITDAYSVILTSEAYTFVGNTSGAPSGLSCSTQIVVYQGNTQCTNVIVTVTPPTGIKADIAGNNGASPIITFTTTATITASCEATIAVTIDDTTINKKFSFSVAKQGNTGETGPQGPKGPQGDIGETGISVIETTRYYKLQDSTAAAPSVPTTNPPSGWTTTEPGYQSGKLLYFVDITVFSNGSVSYSAVSLSSSYKAASDVKDQVDEIKLNYRFDNDGQYIGRENSDTTLRLTNDKIQFIQGAIPSTEVNSKGLVAEQTTVDMLRIGNYFMSVYSDGYLHIT